MFTGLIRQFGVVTGCERGEGGLTLSVKAELSAGLGDSIAIDGCCLTVIGIAKSGSDTVLTYFVADESLRRTNLVERRVGDTVHVEPAMLSSTRLDGHIVQGHVDATATLKATRRDGDSVWLTYAVAPEWTRYMVDKGSITLSGVSLTLTEVGREHFAIMLIPHTQQHTHLSKSAVGATVNIEVDVMAKYFAKWMQPYEEKLRALK